MSKRRKKPSSLGISHSSFPLVGFPGDYWAGSFVSTDDISAVLSLQDKALNTLFEGRRPRSLAKPVCHYDALVFGQSRPDGFAWGLAARPSRYNGKPRWEVAAHEMAHTWLGGGSRLYGQLAFGTAAHTRPLLQEALAVASAFYVMGTIGRLPVPIGSLDTILTDEENGYTYQEMQAAVYNDHGCPFSVENTPTIPDYGVLTSQALDWCIITACEVNGWPRLVRFMRCFSDKLYGKFPFDTPASAEQQASWVAAAGSLTLEPSFAADLLALSFPIHNDLCARYAAAMKRIL